VSADGSTALQIVARKPNQTEIINYLIGKGVDANKADNEGNNALMAAASGKDLNNVKAILPKVKNINAVNANGESALTHAVRYGSPEIVAYLLDNKADVKVADIKGNNLAYYLVQSYRPGPKMSLLKSWDY
jgi:ankyrin repeat protein